MLKTPCSSSQSWFGETAGPRRGLAPPVRVEASSLDTSPIRCQSIGPWDRAQTPLAVTLSAVVLHHGGAAGSG